MVIVTNAVCVLPPPVPVIVNVVADVGFAAGFALTVSVVPVVELVGLNEALVFGGKPLTENVTALVKLPLGVTTTMYCADPRGDTVALGGVADRLKSSADSACTTSVTVVL